MPLSRPALDRRLRAGPPLVLDGATGTELERRGVATRLPLWSAGALDSDPDLVRQIHADYVACGVDAITANTFRTQRRTLAHAGMADRAEELTRRAVALARSAAGDRASFAQRAEGERRPSVWVFGSNPTLEDCYHPERVPDAETLAREHAEHARHLAAAGVDAILVETMNTQREAAAALRAAREVGAPALASFVCWDGARLLSGEPLADALRLAADEDACAVLVNCLPASNADHCLDALAAQPLPFGIYPNLGEPEDELGFRRSEELAPERFGELAAGWAARGARVLGGCCGTTPAHLAALVARIR
jgi:S-methylmethionine-dependent homocysteine/selenocysteine methylase